MINKGLRILDTRVFNDMEIFSHVPDSISLDGVLFTLTLSNKKFIYEDVSVIII